MTTVRDTVKRDIATKVEGVVKVFDRASLAAEIREFVVTDKIEAELKKIVDTFTRVSEVLRLGGTPLDVMGIWVSGFFGSGKSHFAKVLAYLLQNDLLGDGTGEYCIDVFINHLSDTQRGHDLRRRLAEIKSNTQIKTIAFEIKSRQSLSNPNSVGEILLGEFYRSIGLAENFIVARIERQMQKRGLLNHLASAYEAKYAVSWRGPEGRDDLMTVRRRLADLLPDLDPVEYPDRRAAANALGDMFRHATITAEGIADELVAWVDAQKTTGGRVQHLIFVIDEMGTFIGDSNDKIGELNALAEMIGNKGKGKVWIIATSQQDLEKVVDRTNFQPALVGRLNARFELKPHLISDEINKVVSERILKKHPAAEPELRDLYRAHEGPLAQLSDINASRHLGTLSERAFIDCYPFLPHQIRLAQDIFEALSGFRISGGVRSMIAVVMETIQDLADENLGVIASFNQVFDSVENDLLSQEYLGASGIRAIHEADQRVQGAPVAPARVLKVLWLLQRVSWVPRVPETLSKLLIRSVDEDFIPLRGQVEETLHQLQAAGYVARDEATGEWKFLNERERTIEQAIQDMLRPGSPKSITTAAVRRTSQQFCKNDLITKRRLPNFAVSYGKTKATFPYAVSLDGEAIASGPELEVDFISPLASGRKQAIDNARGLNQTAGIKGRRLWWIASPSDALEARLKRHEALVQITGDKRFTEDTSADTQDALSEKRKERDELRVGLVRDLERTFLSGTLFYGGQEIELEGEPDLKGPLAGALDSIIPNLYSGFAVADRDYDFAQDIRALLNPANTALHAVAADLALFDTQGSLQREAPVIQTLLEVVSDLEDEGIDASGATLLDAADSKGFKGFERAPFGWPSEIVRLGLAACFRAGALYLEQHTSAGTSPQYDYKGTADTFLKVTAFKKTVFRIAETSLSVDQIKAASKALIGLGITGTPESGNAIADAVRKLGTALQAESMAAATLAEQGLPIPDALLSGATVLDKAVKAKDPTATIVAFIDQQTQWQALHGHLTKLRAFIDAKRPAEFETSVKLAELARNHPLPETAPTATDLNQALKDMDAIIADKAVIDRWPDYRTAFEQARDAYRSAYLATYDKTRAQSEVVRAEIESGSAYSEAPAPARDQVIEALFDTRFGIGGPCHYPPITLPTTQTLLEACAKHSLTALRQAVLALPAYRSQAEEQLRALVTPPPPLPPPEQTWEWRPYNALAGKRFETTAQVDQALDAISDELKAQIEKGLVVVVK